MAEPAPPIGSIKGASIERITRLVPYTMPYNVSGQPAIGLPLYRTPAAPTNRTGATQGLPMGVQLVARYGEESLLVRLAAQIEAAWPWHDRRPSVHA